MCFLCDGENTMETTQAWWLQLMSLMPQYSAASKNALFKDEAAFFERAQSAPPPPPPPPPPLPSPSSVRVML